MLVAEARKELTEEPDLPDLTEADALLTDARSG
jgi:hypothetical protein